MPDDTQTGAQAATSGAQAQAANAADQHAQAQTTQATGAAASADPNTQSQAGGNAGEQQQQQANKPSFEEVLARLERAEKELGDTRKEAASYRLKAKELDKLKDESDNAKLSEIEKATKAREKAEQALTSSRQRIARAELKVAAKDAGVIDPEDAIAHLAHRIEFDDDGEPKNVAELVKALASSKPHLFTAKADAAAQKREQTAAAGAAMGATNAQRAGGPLTVTADQYLDRAYQKQFRAQHGMDIMAALKAGKVQII